MSAEYYNIDVYQTSADAARAWVRGDYGSGYSASIRMRDLRQGNVIVQYVARVGSNTAPSLRKYFVAVTPHDLETIRGALAQLARG